jgi:hypothetical protein
MSSDEWRAKAAALATDTMEQFFVAREASVLFPGFGALKARLPPRYSTLAAAFQQNMSAVTATVGIPVTLASAAAEGSHWQRIHSAERIRALMLKAEQGEDENALEARRDAQGRKIASERMQEFITSHDGRDNIAADTCRFLLEALNSPNLSAAAAELLLQGTVLAWSALEILSRDLFEAILNTDPKIALTVMKEPTAKQRFQTKFTIEELAAAGFDLSSSLGSLLSSQQDFSDIRTIKAVMLPAVESDSNVDAALGERDLWVLCQQRHLIVHRRGVVDARYLEATGEARQIGERLVVTPAELDSQIEKVVNAGRVLLVAAGKHAV